MRFMDLKLIEAPDNLPVTVEEYIDHARLNGLTVERQEELILRELRTATIRAQEYMRRALITQKLAAKYIPDSAGVYTANLIELPRGRVQSVESIETAGAPLELTGYSFDGWNTIMLAAVPAGAAEVVWIAGYGDTPENVPDAIREGIYEYATGLYEDRAGTHAAKYRADADLTIPRGVKDLWRPYQIEVPG